MQFAPDGRLFILQQTGAIRVVKNGSLLPTAFAGLDVDFFGERGLLGIAFDPEFETNQHLYVYYTVPPATPSGPAHNRISRLTANGDAMVPDSEQVLMDLEDLSASTIHNGGALNFGPDGKLYVAVGENANGPNAQTLNNRLGKMLRINTDGTIPEDNPFFNTATGDNRAIWAMGLRNPFTFAFDGNGTRMFINDVGAEQFEEINEGSAGANYGWPTTEGTFDPSTYPAFTNPRHAYRHVVGGDCAVTGGAFYTPLTMQFPADYAGDYFFADYCTGSIRRFDPVAGGTPAGFATGIMAPVDLKVADDGSLYYLARNSGHLGADGEVWRIAYTPTAPSITTHPANLSVVVGQPATFNVAASGEPPLSYRWQRDNEEIPGAAGAGSSYTIAATTLPDNGATFRVRVTNGGGNALSNPATLTVTPTANELPTATITQPSASTTYNGGSVISYAGTGTDPQDGTLPASAVTWRIDLHHAAHIHPFLPATTGATSGTVAIPTTGHTESNVWYRIHLTVQDAGGFTHSVFRDVLPNKVRVTLNAEPAGLQVNLDGQPQATLVSFDAVVGVMRNLSAPSPLVGGNTTYEFVSWSDGGSATHDVSTPGADIEYTATYRPVSATGPPPAPALSVYTNGLTLSLSWTPAPGATSYVLEGGSAPNAADLLNANIGDLTAAQGIVPAGTYFARVRSVGPGGTSAPSNEVSVAIVGSDVCAAPPPAPAEYTAQVADLNVQLSWSPSPSATSYVLEAGSSSGLANLLNANVGNVQSLTAAAPAGTYFTRLRAVNACGSSSPSTEVPVTLGCTGAPPLSGLTFTKVSGIVTLSWTRSPGAALYGMEVGTAPGFANVLSGPVGDATSLAVNVEGLPPAAYYVRVFAANSCGTSAASNEVAVTVP